MSEVLPSSSAVALSICIPTFNRAATVCALVRRVLSCPAKDIEVVVLDNGSTDETLDKLARIQDPRLSVHSNGVNRGVIFNVLHAMLKGTGRFAALLLDKDSLDPEQIESFKQFLIAEKPACGYCRYGGVLNDNPIVVPAGIPALRLLGYAGHHPTGYFFNRELLHTLDIAKRFSAYEYVGHFPLDFVMAECSLLGRAAIYNAPAFTPENQLAAAKIKSFGTNAAKEDAFFSPKGRLKMTVNFASHIAGLPIDARTRRELILDRLAQGMFAATIGYRRIMRDETICGHYHTATRHIGFVKLVRIGWEFYQSFFLAYPDGRIGADVRLSHSYIVRDWASRLSKGIRRRVIRRAA